MNANTDNWPRPHRLTVDEYYRMAEVGVLAPGARVELIEGEIIDMAPIGSRHAGFVDKLAQRFIRVLGDGAIVGIQRPVRLSRHSEPQPDLVLLRHRPDFYTGHHPTAADALLVVEVSDTTLRYDRETKASLYASHGIPELWIIDIPGQRILFFQEAGARGYARNHIDSQPQRVKIPGFAELFVDLSDLFAF